MSEEIEDSEGHLSENCWCDPYVLTYRVQFHKDKDGKLVQGKEMYGVILRDFEDYLKECFLEMEVTNLIP